MLQVPLVARVLDNRIGVPDNFFLDQGPNCRKGKSRLAALHQLAVATQAEVGLAPMVTQPASPICFFPVPGAGTLAM